MSRVVRTFVVLALALAAMLSAASEPALTGIASWYGEEHRGKLMANGRPFDPDELVAACRFYPLGTTVRVSAVSDTGATNTVQVTITDRGPAPRLVREEGRIIDLSLAAFKTLASPDVGLIRVSVERVAGDEGAVKTVTRPMRWIGVSPTADAEQLRVPER